MVQSSDALGLYEKGAFICPLCRCAIPPRNFNPDYVSLEHVPPRALGGREIVLTCKKCNNYAGSEFESDLSKRVKSFEKSRVISGVTDGEVPNVKLGFFGTELSANLMRKGSRVHLKIDPAHNDPKKLEEFMYQGIEISGRENADVSGSISFEAFRRAHAKWGDIKSAFLALFSLFGYRFAVCDMYRPLAECFKSKKFQSPYPSLYFHTSANIPDILVDQANGVAMVKVGCANVVLPWPSRNMKNFENIRINESLKLEGKAFEFPKAFMGE